MGGACGTYGREARCIQTLAGKSEKGDQFEDLRVDGMVILKFIFNKCDGGHGLD
jgi:hypothetical protein